MHGMTITDTTTGLTSFAVSEDGKVTINGNITMGAGCSIDWNLVDNINISKNPAYTLAQEAKNAMPSYITKTHIDATTIKSPTIMGGTFYGETFNVIAGDTQGSFNLFGSYNSTRYHMLAIDYAEYSSPNVRISSPADAELTIGRYDNGNILNLECSFIYVKKPASTACKIDLTEVASIDFTGVKIIGLNV